jgi:SpoVK/Ycf46/Vps4 family AAA+-type ATPase
MQIFHNGYNEVTELQCDNALIELLNQHNPPARFTPNTVATIGDNSKDFNNVVRLSLSSADSLGFKINHISTRPNGEYTSIIFFHPSERIIIHLYYDSPSLRTTFYGDNTETLKKISEDFLKPFPSLPPVKHIEEEVFFRFWHSWQGKAKHYDKVQTCLGLEEMRKNYPSKVFSQLKKIKDLKKPDDKGKVIIWHGKPGCGKTYAVRALSRDWAFHKGASIEIILDPHEFLSDAGYMRQVILNRPDHIRTEAADDPENPIRLIILEDHAELFTSRCRQSAGLSTILNLTDGILGDDMRLVFLLTANEDIEDIDPAIKRARRCIGVTEFEGFTESEALSWAPEQHKDFFKEHLKILEKDYYELVDLYHIQDLLEEQNATNEQPSSQQVLQG